MMSAMILPPATDDSDIPDIYKYSDWLIGDTGQSCLHFDIDTNGSLPKWNATLDTDMIFS